MIAGLPRYSSLKSEVSKVEEIGILLFGVPGIPCDRRNVRLPDGSKKRTGKGKGSARIGVLKQIRNRFLQHARRFGLILDPITMVTSDRADELPRLEALSGKKWFAVCVGTKDSKSLLLPMLKDRYGDSLPLVVLRWVPTSGKKPLPENVVDLLKQEGAMLIADDAFELVAYLARRVSQ